MKQLASVLYKKVELNILLKSTTLLNYSILIVLLMLVILNQYIIVQA